MMKISGRATICCVALFLAMTSVSAVKRLNSINDLKDLNFGRSVPEHSLRMLYWFANTVEITANNDIRMTFDPYNEDYGSHHYGNYERMLDPLPQGYQYYTIGNIYQESSVQLPSYVTDDQGKNGERNTARIIITVRDSNTGWRAHRINRVYISQHYATEDDGTAYDPQHTYEISTNLLREIGGFSERPLAQLRAQYLRHIEDFQLNDIRNKWGDLAGLGLLLLIVVHKGLYSNQLYFRPQNRPTGNTQAKSSNGQNHQNANYWKKVIIAVVLLLVFLYFLQSSSQTKSRW